VETICDFESGVQYVCKAIIRGTWLNGC